MNGDIVLVLRAFEPGRGLWTEELRIPVELGRLVGVYSRADDAVALIVYAATALDTPQTTEHATEARAFAPDELPWGELTFWSTERALRDFLATLTPR